MLKKKTVSTTDYLNAVRSEIAERRSVQHPIFDYLNSHDLSETQMHFLFKECFYWFDKLPIYIARTANLTKDINLFRLMMQNVADEVLGSKTHQEIYFEFLNSIGVSKRAVLEHSPLAETRALNRCAEQLYGSPPLQMALGGIYFDETMSAIMVEKMDHALIRQGLGAQQRHFWTLHIELEAKHSDEAEVAIFPYLETAMDCNLFELGINTLSDHVESFWDVLFGHLSTNP